MALTTRRRGPLRGLSYEAKAELDWIVKRFEESGNANVLDPLARAYVQGRLKNVPERSRWTESKPTTETRAGGYVGGYDTWANLVARVGYRIEDAARVEDARFEAEYAARRAPPASPFGVPLGTPSVPPQPSPFWSATLEQLDSLLGRQRTNTLIGYAPPPPGSPPGTPRVGENPLDPANRGAIDKVIDSASGALPWVAVGAVVLGVGLVVLVVAVR